MDIVRIGDLCFNAFIGVICKKPDYSINRNYKGIKCNHDIIGLEPPITTTERNIHLKKVYDVKRNDFFVCWKCRRTYKAKGRNAISIMKLCPTCRKNRRYDYYVDRLVYDMPLLKKNNRNPELEHNLVSQEAVYGFNKPIFIFNQDDQKFGLGYYLLSKPHKQGFDKVSDVQLRYEKDSLTNTPYNIVRIANNLCFNAFDGVIGKNKDKNVTDLIEYGYIIKSIGGINRSTPYKWKKSIKNKRDLYYWKSTAGGVKLIKTDKKYAHRPIITTNINEQVNGGTGYRKTSIPLTYQLEYTNWKKSLYGSSFNISIL